MSFVPLWRNKVVAIAAWSGHSFPADGESDYKTIMYSRLCIIQR